MSVVLTDPLVTQAQLGPEPGFDTSVLGTEQPLDPVEDLSTFEQSFLEDDRALVMEQRVAVGLVPGTTRPVFAVTGIVDNPAAPGFGGPGRCYWVASNDDQLLGECHSLSGVEPVRPIATDILMRDWVGWSYLPDEASIAVLTVDDVDEFWQRPRGDIALFAFTLEPDIEVEPRVLDAAGNEIARGDLTDPVDTGESTIVPITGYGDFSTTDYWDIDWAQVTSLTVECMTDHGVPATITADGGISFGDMADDDCRNGQIIQAACRAGLNLPDPKPPTEEQLAATYQALLGTRQCLEEHGYSIEEPPPLDEWIASQDFTPWHPYDSLDAAAASRMNTICPQP